MYYSKLIVGGQEYRLAVNIVGYGPPAVVGDLGMLYVDLDSETIYKCFGGTDWRVAIHTPNITIEGENWHVDGVDTGVSARGEQGERGLPGSLGLHIGPDAPTDGQVAWIDTDEAGADFPAKVGQVVAVKSVGADGKPAEYEGKDLPTVPTPNWTANPGTPGHIENRTHYVDEKGIVHKLDNMYIDADWMATKKEGGGNVVFIPEQRVEGGTWENLQGSLVEGTAYGVEVNGVSYRCVCRNDGDGTLYLGNGSLIGDTAEHNNEPFCVAWMGGTATGGFFYNDGTLESPIGVEVTDWQDAVYNKLPKEYLPEISWNELTDKPFIEGAGEPFFEHTATFATDAAAKNGVLVAGASVTAMLNTVYWLEVNGELYKCHWERESFNSVLYDEDGNKWVVNTLAGVYVSAQTAGTYTWKLYAPTDELMLDPKRLPPNIATKGDIPEGGGADIDVTAQVGQTIIVKEVDANGKPTAWEAADYQPRTHWREEGQEVIVPELTFTPFLNEDIGAYVHPLARFELVEGKTYTVIFDGVSYTCTAIAAVFNDSTSFVAIGNYAIAGGANTGEPFALGVFNTTIDDVVIGQTYVVACFDANEHTVRVIENKIVPHKIPNEYVTPSSFYVTIVAIIPGDISSYVLFTPWEDIINAVRSGQHLYLKLGGIDYNFDQYGELHSYETVTWYACREAKISTNSLECSIQFVMTGSTSGTVSYLTFARDKDGVTTMSVSGD